MATSTIFTTSHLPPEILLNILDIIMKQSEEDTSEDDKARKSTIINLLLVNTATYQTLAPVYYRSMNFSFSTPKTLTNDIIPRTSDVCLHNITRLSYIMTAPYSHDPKNYWRDFYEVDLGEIEICSRTLLQLPQLPSLQQVAITFRWKESVHFGRPGTAHYLRSLNAEEWWNMFDKKAASHTNNFGEPDAGGGLSMVESHLKERMPGLTVGHKLGMIFRDANLKKLRCDGAGRPPKDAMYATMEHVIITIVKD